MTPLRLAGLGLLALAPSTRSAQKVWVVDDTPGPGVDFVRIQNAVDAASEGDAILVKPGSYKPFVVDGKSLVIFADAPPPAVFVGPPVFPLVVPAIAIVRNLAAGQSVSMRGIRFDAFTFSSVRVESCDGAVLIEDCQGVSTAIVSSDDVALVRSKLESGLTATSSSGALYECDLTGPNGGAALALNGSTVFSSGSILTGGHGSNGGGCAPGPFGDCFPFGGCSNGGPGGAGLNINASSVLYRFDTAIAGGAGGAGGFPTCSGPCSNCPGMNGPPGPAIVGTGSVVNLAGANRVLTASATVREGQTLALSATGVPNERVFAFASLAADPTLLLPWSGMYVPTEPWEILDLGTLPVTGLPVSTVTVNVPIGDILPSMQGIPLYVQALFADPSLLGPNFLGSPSATLLLDSAF
ncbi:MAG TPA: hypothetical protein VKE69_12915 [Planctomycetota bacterium]|nr:hypothetical protein [Planctomycetota bacterium]